MATSGVNVREDFYHWTQWVLADRYIGQVLRYSALITGIFYGIYHQSALTSQQKANDLNRKYSAEESLIAKAKAEYVKKIMPEDKKTAGGGGECLDVWCSRLGKESGCSMEASCRICSP